MLRKFESNLTYLYKRSKALFVLCLFFWGYLGDRIRTFIGLGSYFSLRGTLLFAVELIVLFGLISVLPAFFKENKVNKK